MRKNLCSSVRGVILLTLLAGTTCALAQSINNGFPSGPHFNLNIHGKKLDYNCTPVVYDENGLPVYGNSLFVPETGEGIQIVIKSGRKGGKASTLYPTFAVTDACATYFDNDPAEVQLPPNDNGYYVFARALAKPGGAATLSYGGSLFSAEDEYGNDLVYLGLVTSGGVALPAQPMERNKGKSVAVDITKMFMWTGTVCTINLPQPVVTTQTADYRPVCWTDTDGDLVVSSGDTFAAAVVDPATGGYSCAINTGSVIWVAVTCVTYNEPTWIFNIAELVSSDWLIDNEGSKLIQIRFYPVGQATTTDN